MKPEDYLALQQLKIKEWYENWQESEKESAAASKKEKKIPLPEKWCLSEGISLYEWQKNCVDTWFKNHYKGTVKVVTGSGKTILALSVIEKLHNDINNSLRVVIVVPTIVLMQQWYDEIMEKGNIPKQYIGRLGGGYYDDFSDKRILISVLASASKKLKSIVEANSNIYENLLLIADECHSMGSSDRKSVLYIKRKYSLGLSATPERDGDTPQKDNSAYNESELGVQLGKIIYELTYAKALELGIIPPFKIYHYALPLNNKERVKYDNMTRIINDLKKDLNNQAPKRIKTENDFWNWVRNVAQKNGSSINSAAKKLQSEIKRRKELIYGMETRKNAVIKLIERERQINPDSRILLFHETIKDATELYFNLANQGFPVVVEHSKLPQSIRNDNLNIFRKGYAKILVSVKSLIEGFNVPAVDVGIIVASSSSPRQRIQSMGRVMRKYKENGKEKKESKICILYADKTIDEIIYRKLDWERILGVDANLYFYWDIDNEPVKLDGPPSTPNPKDVDIDVEALALSVGDEYPGEFEGDEFSCDSQKNITDENGNRVVDEIGLADIVVGTKGPGKFRITPNKRYVIFRAKEPDGNWITRYITTLDADLKVIKEENNFNEDALNKWLETANVGDRFPYQNISINNTYKFKKKFGGIITKKVKQGESFARNTDKAKDKEKGKDLEKLLDNIRKLTEKNVTVIKVYEAADNVFLYQQNGVYYFICKLGSGLEFPDM